MNPGEYAVCITSGYRINTGSHPASGLEAEAIVYTTGGVTVARFIVGAGGTMATIEPDLRKRAQRRAEAWIEATPDLRTRMQALEHKTYASRGAFWRSRGL